MSKEIGMEIGNIPMMHCCNKKCHKNQLSKCLYVKLLKISELRCQSSESPSPALCKVFLPTENTLRYQQDRGLKVPGCDDICVFIQVWD